MKILRKRCNNLLWYYGIMVLWYYGIVVLWYCGIMVLWYYCIVVVVLILFLFYYFFIQFESGNIVGIDLLNICSNVPPPSLLIKTL